MLISFRVTWQALQHEGWTDTQLAQLQAAFAGYDFVGAMEKAMSMERAMSAVEYERFRSSDTALSEAFDFDPGAVMVSPTSSPSLLSWTWVSDLFVDFPETVHAGIFTPVWKFAWSHHDELHYYRTLQRLLVAQRKARLQNNASALIRRMDQIEEKPRGPYDRIRFVFAPMMYASPSSAFQRAWVAQAAAETAATAIAIKRFEGRHGRLPSALEDLVPEFLTQHPRDCMDGRPLKYCVESECSFRLYSVGIDGRDNGGDPTSPATYSHFENAGDLLWPHPATEVEATVLGRVRRR